MTRVIAVLINEKDSIFHQNWQHCVNPINSSSIRWRDQYSIVVPPSVFHLCWCRLSAPANPFPLTRQVWVVLPPLLEGCRLVLWTLLFPACITYVYNCHFSFYLRGFFYAQQSAHLHAITSAKPILLIDTDVEMVGVRENSFFVTRRSLSFTSTSNRCCHFHHYKSSLNLQDHYLKSGILQTFRILVGPHGLPSPFWFSFTHHPMRQNSTLLSLLCRLHHCLIHQTYFVCQTSLHQIHQICPLTITFTSPATTHITPYNYLTWYQSW